MRWLDGAGIDLVRGHGRLAGERRVAVDTGGQVRTLTARHAVVVATGSRPALPSVSGLAEAGRGRPGMRPAPSSHPASLIVLGGGVAGCELAQA